nr:MAG TPA: hypothetical protein [Caudoviricetes sp.]
MLAEQTYTPATHRVISLDNWINSSRFGLPWRELLCYEGGRNRCYHVTGMGGRDSFCLDI